ncbi:hypothetical protein M3B54_007985 [Micrococcus luteus]|uniref:hypothetical protein n=1 Tax=Micrococcus luteus TaxID=1270 RepID=UPI003F7E1234|nr:hypothetical protein [Micrococcus luteus]
MVQVSWWGRMSTSLPITDEDVAAWAAAHPDLLLSRRADGTTERPGAERVAAFMAAQPHFAQAMRFQYAQAHELVPATAQQVMAA